MFKFTEYFVLVHACVKTVIQKDEETEKILVENINK